MKKILLIGIVLLILPIVFANCDTDYSTLEMFYEASQNEDYDSYIALMDTNYIYDYLADEESYKTFVTSAWDVYDIETYSITLLKCNEIPTGSVMFFNVESTLISDSEPVDLQRDYAAVFENGKLQFVTDLEIFSLHQNQAYALQYLNETKDIIQEELNEAEEMISYIENYDQQSDKKKSNAWIYLVIMIIIILIYFKRKEIIQFAKKHESKVKTVKEQTKKHAKKVQHKTTELYETHVKPQVESVSKKMKKK